MTTRRRRCLPVKILYLCPDLGIPVLGRKGAAVHVREMVNAFRRGGHDAVLAAQMLNKSPWEKPAEFDAPVIQIRPSASATGAVQILKDFNQQLGLENSLPGELRRILFNKEFETELKRRFESDPPHFIYERGSLYATAGVALARYFKVPLLLELNAPLAVEQSTYRATGFGDLTAHVEKWTLTEADAVLTVSALLRDHVLSLGVAPHKIHVFPNGVNTQSFQPGVADLELKKRLGLGDGPVLGFVGGLRPWHGVDALPALLERLVKKFPNVRLVIVGDGPLRGELEVQFRKCGVQQNVCFTGPVAHVEIPAMIRLFDIALAPYAPAEHAFYFSPLKLFEYMACGVAVLAARIGQIPEIIQHNQTGWLYEAGNAEALASACETLLADSQTRRRLGAAAAARVRECHTWDRNALRAAELARELIAQRKTLS
jgi:glycosyltransferase involved in cell wall biosynthesis